MLPAPITPHRTRAVPGLGEVGVGGGEWDEDRVERDSEAAGSCVLDEMTLRTFAINIRARVMSMVF